MKLEYRYSIILALLLLAQMLMACTDNAKNTEIALVSDNTVNIGYGGGEELVKFICYDKWTISSDVSWITFDSPTEVDGNAIIKIRVEKNTSGEDRMGKLSIACGGNIEIIEIKQSVKTIDIGHKHPSILYTREELLNIKRMVEANSSASVTTT